MPYHLDIIKPKILDTLHVEKTSEHKMATADIGTDLQPQENSDGGSYHDDHDHVVLSSHQGEKVLITEKEEIKRPRFSISLTKEEIKLDVIQLTGLKPVRRPKKRAMDLQKHLDTMFPGLLHYKIITFFLLFFLKNSLAELCSDQCLDCTIIAERQILLKPDDETSY